MCIAHFHWTRRDDVAAKLKERYWTERTEQNEMRKRIKKKKYGYHPQRQIDACPYNNIYIYYMGRIYKCILFVAERLLCGLCAMVNSTTVAYSSQSLCIIYVGCTVDLSSFFFLLLMFALARTSTHTNIKRYLWSYNVVFYDLQHHCMRTDICYSDACAHHTVQLM